MQGKVVDYSIVSIIIACVNVGHNWLESQQFVVGLYTIYAILEEIKNMLPDVCNCIFCKINERIGFYLNV